MEVIEQSLSPFVSIYKHSLNIVDLHEHPVLITVYEMNGSSGSVFALELPPENAERRDIGPREVPNLFNRAITTLAIDRPSDSPFSALVPLPTMEGKGMTGEPHRLFVVATRAEEGHEPHRADLGRLARKAEELGMRAEITMKDQMYLTVKAPADTTAAVSELNLNGALGTLYRTLELIHGDSDHPTHLRVVGDPRNAYRMTGGTRAFALTVASV